MNRSATKALLIATTAAVLGTTGLASSAWADGGTVAPAPQPTIQPKIILTIAPQPTEPSPLPTLTFAPRPTQPADPKPTGPQTIAPKPGEAPSAVYVKVSRLKDSLGRAAGVLLVARHHREDCNGLDALLGSWDGSYSTLWRKRIARHVDDCSVCGGSRKTAAAALFALAVCAPVPLVSAVRNRCVSRTASPDMVPVSFAAGWPETRPWPPDNRRRRGGLLVAVGALLLLLGGAGGAALANIGERLDLTEAVATQTTTAPSTPVAAPPAAASPYTQSAAATTAPPTPSPKPTPSLQPTPKTTPTPSPSADNAPSAPASTAPAPAPVPPAPTVQLALQDSTISTACGTPSTTQAVVDATGQSAQTLVQWGGTAPGIRGFPGSGSATIGPYSSVTGADGSDTVTVTATVTDALGRAVKATRTLTVDLAPC